MISSIGTPTSSGGRSCRATLMVTLLWEGMLRGLYASGARRVNDRPAQVTIGGCAGLSVPLPPFAQRMAGGGQGGGGVAGRAVNLHPAKGWGGRGRRRGVAPPVCG